MERTITVKPNDTIVIRSSASQRRAPRKKVSKAFAMLHDTRYALVEFPVMQKKEIEEILKKRQYVEVDDGWKKGFVKVTLQEDFMVIKHDVGKHHEKGVKCFYDKNTFMGLITYMERINNFPAR